MIRAEQLSAVYDTRYIVFIIIRRQRPHPGHLLPECGNSHSSAMLCTVIEARPKILDSLAMLMPRSLMSQEEKRGRELHLRRVLGTWQYILK